MIFDTKEAQCTIKVLSILAVKESKYNLMFRATKVSHTTLQRVLKDLDRKRLIKKHDTGHMKVDYEITDKGRKVLFQLKELEQAFK